MSTDEGTASVSSVRSDEGAAMTDATTEPAIDWAVGQELEPRTLPPVTRLKLIHYAGASGDYNPIHTIDQGATEAGLPGVIQHGMLTMAELGRLFSPYLGQGSVQHVETRFSGMVFLGDALTVGGTVTAIDETEHGRAYRFDVYSKNQKGQNVATGKVTFVVDGGR